MNNSQQKHKIMTDGMFAKAFHGSHCLHYNHKQISAPPWQPTKNSLKMRKDGFKNTQNFFLVVITKRRLHPSQRALVILKTNDSLLKTSLLLSLIAHAGADYIVKTNG
jgi:hypothetical protein